MTLDYRVGDAFERMKEIPDGTIDLIVTSPPFLALRSYLPADHPDKAKEIGSEPTPAAFIDTLLALTAEFGRVLAPHGSICVELGDTYSGSGGGGGDYNPGGIREGQQRFDGSASAERHAETCDLDADCSCDFAATMRASNAAHWRHKAQQRDAWPLAKSLTGIPTLYPWSLAYGRNLLTGQESPAGLWRIRNVIVWARPNPPVGALGDKFRPATSYITVACRGARRFFDLDAVRTPYAIPDQVRPALSNFNNPNDGTSQRSTLGEFRAADGAGAPPLDWHTDHHPEDGDWLWKLPTQPYKGSHYATYPLELPTRLIMAMCPLRVCTVCGKPSERIVETSRPIDADDSQRVKHANGERPAPGRQDRAPEIGWEVNRETSGWSDCGCSCPVCLGGGEVIYDHSDNPYSPCRACGGKGTHTWRTGVVLDPFAGSGTTLEAAQNVGRHAIGIDLDPRNAHLAQQRVGMFLTVNEPVA